ncbi:hypothetical protein V2G77_000204 [Enterobacter kobei]|uniref:hypothetical protein n=1 Tax=Enterobacter kobei TaxID=208224 RepID=UPI00294C6C4B|nr:hypothetical protein [Enterobacter kobei]
MGIPAAVSTLGVIVSFAIPQLWLGYGILTALDQPAERVFVWVVLVALLFAGHFFGQLRLDLLQLRRGGIVYVDGHLVTVLQSTG